MKVLVPLLAWLRLERDSLDAPAVVPLAGLPAPADDDLGHGVFDLASRPDLHEEARQLRVAKEQAELKQASQQQQHDGGTDEDGDIDIPDAGSPAAPGDERQASPAAAAVPVAPAAQPPASKFLRRATLGPPSWDGGDYDAEPPVTPISKIVSLGKPPPEGQRRSARVLVSSASGLRREPTAFCLRTRTCCAATSTRSSSSRQRGACVCQGLCSCT
jgi:hypothetical protein